MMENLEKCRARAANVGAKLLIAAAIATFVLAIPRPVAAQDPGAAWETAAGGKMSFDVASVKANTSGSPYGASFNIAQEPDDGEDFTPSGGLFDAKNWPLWMYVAFAYKLPFDQAQILRSEAPKWVVQDNFDIQGRAAGNPTKDQYRLMVQALLADRFKMMAAWDMRQGPVDALELLQPGKTGPQLRPYRTVFPALRRLQEPRAAGSLPRATKRQRMRRHLRTRRYPVDFLRIAGRLSFSWPQQCRAQHVSVREM